MLIEIFKLIEGAIRKNEKKLIVILKDYKRSCVSVNLPDKTLSKLGLTFARSREEIISSSVRARGREREGSAFSPSSPPWVVCTVAGMATLPPLLFLSLPHLFLSLTLRISLELSSGKVFRPQLFRTRGLPLAGSRSLLKTSDISLSLSHIHETLTSHSISVHLYSLGSKHLLWILAIFFQVEDNICKFAKKGLTPSQIGVILRDSHGIAQVKSVTGSKILRILKAHGMRSVC